MLVAAEIGIVNLDHEGTCSDCATPVHLGEESEVTSVDPLSDAL